MTEPGELEKQSAREVSHKAQVFELEIGRKAQQQYLDELAKNNVAVGQDAFKVLHSRDFITANEPTSLKLGSFRAGDIAGVDIEEFEDKFKKYREEKGLEHPDRVKLMDQGLHVSTRQIYEGAKNLD